MNTHTPLLQNSGKESKILSINFNQDQGCFALGHEHGFLVYNTNPIDLRVRRNFFNPNANNGHNNLHFGGSGIGHVTMLHRTNYLALVGGGKNPKFANNKVIIWDDLKRKNSLSLEFMSPVLNVLLSRIRIIVVLKNQVSVYGFSAPPKKFATYETIENEHGLAELSVNSSSTSIPHNSTLHYNDSATISSSSSISLTQSSISTSSKNSKDNQSSPKYQTLAFPGRSIGQIQLVDVSPAGQEKNLVSIIKAHKSKIRCLALNRSGTLIASASETGTIIRIHSTYNTVLLYEFRRGLDRAVITSMKFSHDDSKLAVLSDKNTLHVYNVSSNSDSSKNNRSPSPNSKTSDFTSDLSSSSSSLTFGKENPTNRQHLLKKFPIPIPIPNYFNSTWSFCSVNTNQYRNDSEASVNGDDSNDTGVIGWSGNDSVIVIWKGKRIWEKYVIVEKQKNSNKNDKDVLDLINGKNSQITNWEIIRYSWKSLDNLNENKD